MEEWFGKSFTLNQILTVGFECFQVSHPFPRGRFFWNKTGIGNQKGKKNVRQNVTQKHCAQNRGEYKKSESSKM